MNDLGGSERLIHTRLEQILHDWCALPAISASKLAQEYARRHGIDFRVRAHADELLHERWWRLGALRSRHAPKAES
jgi:hypothetical protein